MARGRELFRNYRCANCHGVDGRGSPNFPGAPTLIGRTAADLATALVEACADPFEGGCHPLKIPDLPSFVLEDIAAYLSFLANDPSFQPNPGPPCDTVPGNICTIAGNGIAGNKPGESVLAREQFLFWPQDATVDPEQRVVITDWNNYLIRRISSENCRDFTDPMGRTGRDCPVENLVGTSGLGDSCTTSAAPVLAKNSTMNHPVGVTFFPDGDMILWGWHQWKVKFIPRLQDGSYGEMYCVFGNARGFGGDGQPAGTNWDGMGGPVRFNLPSSAVRDARGNWYVSDQGNLRIRVIRADGDDAPDTAPAAEWVASLRNNVVETLGGGEPRTTTGAHRQTKADYSDSGDGGPVLAATFRVQYGFDALPQMRLAIDEVRDLLYVADSENGRIRVIDLSASPPTIATFAGGGTDVAADDVPATEAKLYRPGDVDVFPDGSGDLLIADVYNNCVRVVDFDTRRIRTVAGRCGADTFGYEGDGGPANMALLNQPGGAGVALDGTIYVADTLNHRVRRVNP